MRLRFGMFRVLLIYILTAIIYYICTVMPLSKPCQGKMRRHMSLSPDDYLCVTKKLEKETSV